MRQYVEMYSRGVIFSSSFISIGSSKRQPLRDNDNGPCSQALVSALNVYLPPSSSLFPDSLLPLNEEACSESFRPENDECDTLDNVRSMSRIVGRRRIENVG